MDSSKVVVVLDGVSYSLVPVVIADPVADGADVVAPIADATAEAVVPEPAPQPVIEVASE